MKRFVRDDASGEPRRSYLTHSPISAPSKMSMRHSTLKSRTLARGVFVTATRYFVNPIDSLARLGHGRPIYFFGLTDAFKPET
jgi:hypothetical protein